jgi:amino-acid N-acetyltransferase
LIRARNARLQDAKAIHQLIESFTCDGTLLRRSYQEICRNIHTFTVVETDTRQFIGCASLHIYGPHLAEIRSIVVRPGAAGRGAGSLLVKSLLQQAKQAAIKCVCLFTRIPVFFERFHFQVAEHQSLQDKLWKDCQHCSRRNACDETAMVIGELPPPHHMPSIERIHRAPRGGLVQLQL